MTIIVQSHTYSINFDQVCYIRVTEFDQTLFTMTNGRKVRITCPYDTVIEQISSSIGKLDSHGGIIALEYPIRSEVFID